MSLTLYHPLWYRTCVQELDVTWAQMEFGHEVHQRTSLKLISASEELIETLEDNQVELNSDNLCLCAPKGLNY